MPVDKLGRYEIKKELARGGMATVYIAYDPVTKRNVALKVLPPQFTHDPKFYDRFQIEVATLALLEHAAIVPVYDFGEDHEFPYLVMRLMLGGTLAARIDGAPLPLAEALTITRRICAALDKAHRKGVIHRDIKPSNILFDEDGYAYLGDFGIVKMAEATRTTQMIGTPEYMAPEQIEDQPLDRRTDVYQMGIVLFEMLTGRQLYTAESPIALLFKHVQAPIPALQEFNPELPASCQDVINKALAKNPQNRYATTGELASAIEQAIIPGDRPVVPAKEKQPGTAIRPKPTDEPPAEQKQPGLIDKVPPAKTYTDNKTGLEMIYIPAGTFLYGKDTKQLELSQFWISKTPITNAQYARFVSATGHDLPKHWNGKTPTAELASHPVAMVRWLDARAYASWAGMYLPTEEEWEKAARGTDGRRYPWGDEWRAGYCNTSEAGVRSTTPVGHYSPQGDSPYGCVDVAGNVWEWTASLYGKKERRVVRGASWTYDKYSAHAAFRHSYNPAYRYLDIGFRVVVRRPPSR